MSLSTFSDAADGSAGSAIPVELAERLADPNVAEGLVALLDRLEVINLVFDSLEGLLAHSETIMDSVVASAADARETIGANTSEAGAGEFDLGASTAAAATLLAALPEMAPALLRGAQSGAIDALTSSGMVSTLHMVADGAMAGRSDRDPVQVNGVLSVARALKDPDIARTLSYFLTVARAIGKELASHPATTNTQRAS